MAPRTRILESGFRELTRDKQGPVGRDLNARALRVTKRMKELATGVEGGPQIRTGTLQSSIAYLRFGDDGKVRGGLFTEVGVREFRTIKRGWNYAILLEGPNSVSDSRIEVTNKADFGDAARRPFIARSLLAAAD